MFGRTKKEEPAAGAAVADALEAAENKQTIDRDVLLAEYRRVVVVEGAATVEERAHLRRVADALGFTPDQVAEDLEVGRDYRKAAPLAAGLTAACAALTKAQVDYDAACDRVAQAERAKTALWTPSHEARKNHEIACGADLAVKRLRRDRPDLFPEAQSPSG